MLCFTFAAVFRVPEERKSSADRPDTLNKPVLWSAVISSAAGTKVLHIQTIFPPSVSISLPVLSVAVKPPEPCREEPPASQSTLPQTSALAGPREVFVWFPQHLISVCAPCLLLPGMHQRLSGHLSAASLSALTTSSRPTQTSRSAGEAVAIQTVPESTSNVYFCLPGSTLEAG